MNRRADSTDDRRSRTVTALMVALLSVAVLLLIAILGVLLFGRAIRATSEVAGQTVIPRDDANGAVTRETSQDQEHPLQQVIDPVNGNTAADPAPNIPLIITDPPPLLPGIALPELPSHVPLNDALLAAPQLDTARGRTIVRTNPLDEAAILAEDALIPRPKEPTGPTAQLSIFGSGPAEGRSFVFVIDHSNSMGGEGLGAIQAAAKELAAHIDQLTDQQTFQVVAYNQSVAWLTSRELILASADNKRQLVRFVANLAAYGQTEHYRGLLSALQLKPEVIFLLTDGGDPPLDPGQLKLIREQTAGRTVIHCIHFGRGPASDRPSFLVRLARENQGSYAYVDMNLR